MSSIEQIMTRDPSCSTPETTVRDVARMMLEHDCGEIPIVESGDKGRVIGVVTDRDITCRVVAVGKDPQTTTVSDVMTDSVVTIRENADLAEALEKMEQYQVRRLPVVDAQGNICGIISQADVALRAGEREAGEVVRDVSRPGPGSPGAHA